MLLTCKNQNNKNNASREDTYCGGLLGRAAAKIVPQPLAGGGSMAGLICMMAIFELTVDFFARTNKCRLLASCGHSRDLLPTSLVGSYAQLRLLSIVASPDVLKLLTCRVTRSATTIWTSASTSKAREECDLMMMMTETEVVGTGYTPTEDSRLCVADATHRLPESSDPFAMLLPLEPEGAAVVAVAASVAASVAVVVANV